MIRRILFSSVLVAASGCTVLDLWDTPAVIVEDRPCNDVEDCAAVQFEITDPAVRMDACIVAKRICDTAAGHCTVSLEARDSDDDEYRDVACRDQHPEFEPTQVDCDDTNDDAFPNADFDRDTFFARGCGGGRPEDCDDTRATAFPGATIEACDGVVSACTDTTSPARRLEEDFDGDRFAPVGLAESVCSDVFGNNGALISAPRTDCDDADALVFPDAPEVCDGRDNDCNEASGVGPDPREDADGDGFSSPTTNGCDVAVAGGFPATDCDDTNGKTYPGAPESCDLIVNDCDARTGSNFARPSEDSDADQFFASDADCIDPVANIECAGAGFDAFSQYCAPRLEHPIVTELTNQLARLEAADLNGDGIDEVLLSINPGAGPPAPPSPACGANDQLRLFYSTNAATPAVNVAAACGDARISTILLANVDADPALEVVTADGTSVHAFDVSVAGSTMALSAKAIMAPAAGAFTIVPSNDAPFDPTSDRAALAIGNVDGVAGPEVVAVEGSSLVYRSIGSDGVLVSAATAIATYAGGVKSIVIGDVTSDGLPDVVVGLGDEIRIHPKSSGAGFDSVQIVDLSVMFPGLGSVAHLALGDVEGSADGDLDIVVGGTFGLALLAHRGAGFEGVTVGITPAGAPLPVTGIKPSSIAVRDLDGDGRSEILYATFLSDTLAYVDERGTNIFVQHVLVSDFDGASRVAAADVDGDRDVDVVGFADNQKQLSWFESTFVSNFDFDAQSVDRAFDSASDVEVADMDADGRLDVVSMAANSGGEIHVWRSRTATASAFDELFVHTNTGSAMTGMSVGDGNGDDRLDIAIVIGSLDGVGFLRGNGDRTWAASEALQTFDAPSDVIMADLDADGNDEIIVASLSGTDGRVAAYSRPPGQNTFTRTVLAAGSAPCVGLAVGQLDDDALPDLAVACGTTGLIALRNPGTIAGGWTEVALDTSAGARYSTVALGDLDRDGDTDVVGYRDDLESVAIQLIEAGAPTGSLLLSPLDVDSAAGADLTIADLDSDGDFDIIVAGRTSAGAIRVFQAVDAPRGRFVPVTVFPGGGSSSPSGVAAGDLNGDGRPDIVATLTLVSDVVWWGTTGSSWWDH